ncbi:unnamed protein product [Lactuca saligna]|uniref:Protein FAR1-RELATED SEQUENCE n=1 Tax=Lactuca saligna TaxID=75948 RepID=A0AA36A4Q0_LACSI|nr:unnamed protein product [Lactuca saligna]
MDDIHDFDTIDVELDAYFKKKQASRCKDEFLNILCKEDDYEAVDDAQTENDAQTGNNAQTGITKEESDEDYLEGSNEEGSDEEFEYSTHNPKVKWNKMRSMLGERYESPHELKLCLTNYDVSKGFQIRFKKCDSVRLVAICGSDPEKCPFVVRASWMTTERSFQVKKMIDIHKCVRNFNNSRLMDPTWLARKFVKELIRKPNLKCKEMQVTIQSKFHCKISWSKCYRSRMRALSLIHGNLSDHYARVWDYGHELLRSNPNSIVRITVTVNPDNTTTFHRFYICFKAIREGWKRACRRVIGLDGSFLKGQCKGELLTAIGGDANNQVYLIAWAVVDVENKNNWKWFLDLVNDDLGLQGGKGVCVISDQHKGLVEASKDILPYVEHRQCARHIYANFRKVYSGVQFRNMFWAAAKSTTEGDFKFNMERIRAISFAAYDHLMAREPTSWCRAYFSTGLVYEAVENEIVECFTAIIVDARKKPLLTMLEEIRLYMMERAFNMKQEAENLVGEVCPSAVTKMEEFGEDIKSWHAVPSGVNEYENIHPVNGSILWEETSYTKPFPPIERRIPGRPSVKRRRHVSENQDNYSQVSSKGRTVQCKNCLQRGHNKTSCKNPIVALEPQPKKKMDRPKLEPDLVNWSGTKTGSRGGGRAGGRVGGGRSRGGGKGSSRRGNRGGGRGFSEGVQTKYGEGTSEFPKCEPEVVVIPNVESENDASPDFHNHISLTIDNLRKSLYTTEEIMDCLGLSEAELQQIDGLGLSEAEVQKIEDVDVAMSQDVGIASQIIVEELPTNQVLGDEERMNGEDGIDEPGMGEDDYKEEQSESSQEEEAFGKDNRDPVAKGGSCQEWKGDEFIQPP